MMIKKDVSLECRRQKELSLNGPKTKVHFKIDAVRGRKATNVATLYHTPIFRRGYPLFNF